MILPVVNAIYAIVVRSLNKIQDFNGPGCEPATNISGFIAQLIRASHLYREVTGSNPVEVLNFFRASYAIASIAFTMPRIILHLISFPQLLYQIYFINVYNILKMTIWRYKSYLLKLKIAPCKGIHDSLGFWIPPYGFRIPSTGCNLII